MGTTLYLLTNVGLTNHPTPADWRNTAAKLNRLALPKTQYINAQKCVVEEPGAWSFAEEEE